MAGQVSKAVEKADGARNNKLTLRDSIQKNQSQFALALPRHVTPDRFMRAALTALNTVKNLGDCTQSSVMAGLMQAAQLGLEVADVRGQAYLIPRWNSKLGGYEATFQLGVRGMIDMAARAGITVSADVIYENDAYDFERGTNARLYHKPTLNDPGKAIAYYAVAHFAGNRKPEFYLMSKQQVELHRDRFASTKNKAGEIYGPWQEHFDSMALKTVVRRLLDKLPTAVELRQAVSDDAVAEQAGQITYSGATFELPDNVDMATGEILDTSDVIDVESDELPLVNQ